MLLELDKTDLISLVKGTTPSYSLFDYLLVKKCGNYSGSYDRWSWNDSELKELEEIQLYSLYSLCKSHR